MGNEEDIIMLRNDMETCRSDMYRDIKELKQGHAEFKLTLREQAIARKEYNDTMNEKLDAIRQDFKDHTSEEMGTIKDILGSLKELADAVKDIKLTTNDNTDFIEDFKKKWFKYSVIASTVASMFAGAYMVYGFLQKNGFVFYIEKVGS